MFNFYDLFVHLLGTPSLKVCTCGSVSHYCARFTRSIEIYRDYGKPLLRHISVDRVVLTHKHVEANVVAVPARCSGSLARTHTRVKDLYRIGVR